MQLKGLPLIFCVLTFISSWFSITVVGQEVPALPAASDGSQRTQIPVGGARVSLDHLGPAIVNEDGTLRRITNWADLSDRERAVALRRIADRNKARLELLRNLKEVQKQEQEREERLQRILKTPGDAHTSTSPVAAKLVSANSALNPESGLEHEPSSVPLPPQGRIRSIRGERKTPDERERERAQYQAAEEQEAAHIVQVNLDWSLGSDNTTSLHAL